MNSGSQNILVMSPITFVFCISSNSSKLGMRGGRGLPMYSMKADVWFVLTLLGAVKIDT